MVWVKKKKQMILKLEETQQQLTDEELNEFSQFVGNKIPDDFINFYRQFNGGTFIQLDSKMSNYVDDKFLINFFSIKYGLTIENIYAQFKRDFPQLQDMLPFASDLYLNCYLLSLRPQDNGCVYYWSVVEQKLTLQFESFNCFILFLYEVLQSLDKKYKKDRQLDILIWVWVIASIALYIYFKK